MKQVPAIPGTTNYPVGDRNAFQLPLLHDKLLIFYVFFSGSSRPQPYAFHFFTGKYIPFKI